MSLADNMRGRARIAFLAADRPSHETLTNAFNDAGYDIVGARDDSSEGYADVGVVDLRNRDINASQARRITSTLRGRSPECSIVFLVDPVAKPQTRNILNRSGEIIAIDDNFAPAIERCREIIRLRSLAEETGERLKSLAELTRLADFPPISPATDPGEFLIAGPPGAVALSAAAAAQNAAAKWTGVISPGQSLRAIESGRFDGAILLPNEQNDLLQSLARSIQRNPSYADFPIIHIAADCEELAALVEKGARDFLIADHIEDELPRKIASVTRRARLAHAMRQFLGACAGDGVRDPASGVFTGSFLALHGARLAARADQTHKAFCLAGIKLTPRSPEGGAAAPTARILRQAGDLIRRVTRATDLTARLSSDSLAIATPGTPHADTERICERIAGVISNTLFRGARNELYSVDVQWNVALRTPGLRIEETLAAALSGLTDRPPVRATSSPRPQSPR